MGRRWEEKVREYILRIRVIEYCKDPFFSRRMLRSIEKQYLELEWEELNDWA
jgi:hypothetical protein